MPRLNFRVGVPRAGYWREILNSDAEVYGGSGLGNQGGMHSDGHGAHGFEQALVVTLPPLAIVVFVLE